MSYFTMFTHISLSALLALPLLASAGVTPVILPRDDIVGRQVTISPVLPTLPRAIISRQVVTISPVISPVLPREDGTDITGRQITIPALPAPPAIPALPTLKTRQVPAYRIMHLYPVISACVPLNNPQLDDMSHSESYQNCHMTRHRSLSLHPILNPNPNTTGPLKFMDLRRRHEVTFRHANRTGSTRLLELRSPIAELQ
ncbi:hypothetical protein F5146DRAFT_1162685 [Armillaria mellea]|nr:hypothetical protein F5146DRAFT_1162685 [Armillaria mellea]